MDKLERSMGEILCLLVARHLNFVQLCHWMKWEWETEVECEVHWKHLMKMIWTDYYINCIAAQLYMQIEFLLPQNGFQSNQLSKQKELWHFWIHSWNIEMFAENTLSGMWFFKVGSFHYFQSVRRVFCVAERTNFIWNAFPHLPMSSRR